MFSAAARHASARRSLSDAARKRDPTQSNDIRNRIATDLRRGLALWRSQVYAALVEADQFGYAYGDVDPEDIEALIERLDLLLHRQAEFAFSNPADNMDIMLRTAYARGVRKAGEEVTPVLPLTSSTTELIIRARSELEDILEDQIQRALETVVEEDELAAAAVSSRHKLYGLVLLPLLLKPLAKRLKSLSTTNVTRAFNTGKIDAYEVLGIEEVGVEAESLPGRHPPAEQLPPEKGETIERLEEERRAQEEPTLPEGVRYPEFYTVETVGDDRVCDICESYEGNTYTLAEARALIPAHPNCRCSIVPVL